MMITKNLFYKIAIVIRRDGLSVLLFKRIPQYLKYIFYDQWRFVYFVFPLSRPLFSISKPDLLKVREVTVGDVPKIQRELFPLISDELKNDKNYFTLIGEPGIHCFVGEQEGRVVHYAFVFTELTHSPLLSTRLRKTSINPGDIFVGPVFTDPKIRGAWVYPYVLQTIMEQLQAQDAKRRVIVFVSKDNPGATSFFRRLGFNQIY